MIGRLWADCGHHHLRCLISIANAVIRIRYKPPQRSPVLPCLHRRQALPAKPTSMAVSKVSCLPLPEMNASPASLSSLPATQELFRADSYLQSCEATVLAVTDAGIVLDRTVFYPLGGGQAGDAGTLRCADGRTIAIADTRKAKADDGQPLPLVLHVPAQEDHGLQAGDQVTAAIDWQRRHRLMRLHTASHVLCHLVPHLVNGCSITPEQARIDFVTNEAIDKDAVTAELAAVVAQALPVQISSITDAELDANPTLVKSMSVQPPRGSGRVRTVRIGGSGESDMPSVDFQPCGGTHLANTAEIGTIVISKTEKKGANSRRVILAFVP